jgi:hypothetical protein
MQGEQLLQDQSFSETLKRSPFEEKDLPVLATSIADTFDRMTPEQKVELRKATEGLEALSVEELTTLDQAFAYIQENSERYPEVVGQIVATGALDKEDLPEEYNADVIAVVRSLIQQTIRKVGGGQESEAPGPAPEQPGFARGGIVSLQKAAQQVQSAGRKGDSVLAHINPMEAAMLKRMGGRGTINPKTGLPEFGWFSSIWKAVRPVLKIGAQIVGTAVLTPFVGPIAAGAIVGGVSSLLSGGNARENITAALFGGASAGLTAGISSSLSNGSFFDGAFSGGSFFGGGAPQGNAISDFFGFTGGGGTPAAGAAAGEGIRPSVDVPSDAGGGEIYSSDPSKSVVSQATKPTVSAPSEFFGKAANYVKENKFPLLIGAGVGALAGGAMGGKEKPPGKIKSGKTGFDYLAENPERYAFDISKFRPTVAPTYPVFPGGGYVSSEQASARAPIYDFTQIRYPTSDGNGIMAARAGGHINGPGNGTSDSIPARLSDGEFVMTAQAVRGAGGGSRAKGARKMYDLMNKFERMA